MMWISKRNLFFWTKDSVYNTLSIKLNCRFFNKYLLFYLPIVHVADKKILNYIYKFLSGLKMVSIS